jgi:hypothetical protein
MKKNSLAELFDKFDMQQIYYVPENSLVTDLENITFGPSKYPVTIK